MSVCDYCGEELPRTGGKTVVLNSGEKLDFCSGKCEKNWKKDRGHGYGPKQD